MRNVGPMAASHTQSTAPPPCGFGRHFVKARPRDPAIWRPKRLAKLHAFPACQIQNRARIKTCAPPQPLPPAVTQ